MFLEKNVFILFSGPSGIKTITRKQIVDLMNTQNDLDINGKLMFAENHLISQQSYTEEQIKDIKHRFSYIKTEIKKRWIAAKNRQVFYAKNEDWLNGIFELPNISVKPGRPTKAFDEASERSKRRKTEELRLSESTEKIIYAAQMELRARGDRSASNILREISENKERAHEYNEAVHCSKPHVTQVSLDDALDMFSDANLTRAQYNRIRDTTGNLPCYSLLQQHKRTRYPPQDSFTITETSAEIRLQDLINHTAQRLLKHLEDVLSTLSDTEGSSLTMICKWGCDGSQQAQFKQRFENDGDSDAHMFQSSFVPLRITYGSNCNILWQNPSPSSPNFCRPIRMRFVKETVDITNEEIKYVEDAAKMLEPTVVTFGEKTYSVKCNMLLTMIDGKVCNAVTDTKSTMRCYLCNATSKDFNKLLEPKEVDKENLRFGLSTLHARIRLFESLLHIAYKLPVPNWPSRSEADKLIIKNNKERIQKEFKHKLGLRVDFPKSGFGNTNDGNTSRRFFEDPELAAEITGLDVTFISKIKTIIQCITSGYKIDIKKFEKFTRETAELYVQLYNRHPMTPTMHKILIHGPMIIEHALVPIGLLSEEAAEARNKHIRLFRQDFGRKFSRKECMTDVLNRLLLTSDPLFAARRKLQKKNKKKLMPETLDMLICEQGD